MKGFFDQGDDPKTFGGAIMATHEIGTRANYTTADAALNAARKGDAFGLAALGTNTLAAQNSAKEVMKLGFGLQNLDTIFGKP